MPTLPDTTEHWKPVVGYEGFYEVSDTGYVRLGVQTYKSKHPKGKILTFRMSPKGYVCVALTKGGKRTGYPVHKLVMAAFVGPCPPGKERNHKDGEKTNNRVSNLEYVTHAENMRHALVMGLFPSGERMGSAKLTEENVREIRKLAGVVSHRELGKRFGVSRGSIQSILYGQTWTRVK